MCLQNSIGSIHFFIVYIYIVRKNNVVVIIPYFVQVWVLIGEAVVAELVTISLSVLSDM